jgi:VWFA-related protein
MNRRTIAITAAATLAAALPLAAQQETRPAAEPLRQARMVVLFIDSASLQPDELARAVDVSKKYVLAETDPSVVMAVLSHDGMTVQVKQDFTADADALLKALDSVRPVAPGATSADPGTQAARLETAIKTFTGLPQKKVLVCFTRGANGDSRELQSAIQAALHANFAIYPIDVRGIQPAK